MTCQVIADVDLPGLLVARGSMTCPMTAAVPPSRCDGTRSAAHTFTVFQRPRLNSHSVNTPTAVSETNTPQNTPE